jgi:hypothetical protein
VSNFLTGGEGERVVRERPRSCSCVALNKDSQCCGMQLVGLTRVFLTCILLGIICTAIYFGKKNTHRVENTRMDIGSSVHTF